MTGFVYRNAPKNIFHSWVEVYFEGHWYELEAIILDKQYLDKENQEPNRLINRRKETGLISIAMNTMSRSFSEIYT